LASASRDATARVWEVATGKVLLILRGHESFLSGVAYGPDGAWLATTSNDNTIRIWDAATGQQLHKLDGHSGTVNQVAFSPDGRRLASTSEDGTVRVWDTSTWRQALTLRVGHSLYAVSISADGTRLVSGGKIWDARPLTPELGVEREALGLLEYLFAKPLRKADVRDYLRDSPTIRPEARQLALSLVERYREEDNPDAYHRAAWAVVRQRYLNPFQYRFALRQADTARQLAPKPDIYLATLGAAQYRVGQYREALATLTKGDPLGTPTVPAFLALTHHQLGQKDQARTALARLRQSLKEPRWANSEEAGAILREAAGLIESPQSPPRPPK
jgi:hypothetical protein